MILHKNMKVINSWYEKAAPLSVLSAQGTPITNINYFMALIAWEIFSPAMATVYMKAE